MVRERERDEVISFMRREKELTEAKNEVYINDCLRYKGISFPLIISFISFPIIISFISFPLIIIFFKEKLNALEDTVKELRSELDRERERYI